jgi:putative membrane protein
MFDKILIWLHVTGNVFWIGAVAAIALVMLASDGEAKLRGELAKRIYMLGAVPGFVLSFGAGVARLMMDPGPYMKLPFFHAKLTVALIAIVLHHIIGARAKKLASGEAKDAGPTKVLFAVFAVCAILAVFFVVVRIPGGG